MTKKPEAVTIDPVISDEAMAAAGLADGATGGEQGELIGRDNRLFEPSPGMRDKATGLPYETARLQIRGDHIALTDDGPGYFVQGEETGSRYEPTHAEKTASLIARIDAHEAEGAAIEAVMTELGHDAKSIRTIKRARAKAEAAKRTYDALFGAGIVSPGQV